MRVGLVCPYNMYKGGGVQECVRAVQLELEKRGHYVRILTPQPRVKSDQPVNNVIFIGTAAQIRSPFHTTAQVSVSVKTDVLEDVLEAEQFDVLHFHEPWVPILSRQILARSTAANVATFHAKLPDTVMSRTIEKVITPYTRSILKDLDCLTAVSEAAEEYVKTLTDQPIHIVANGIDLVKYSSVSPKKARSNILYIGRLEKRKGLKYLIQAFSVLDDSDAELTIAGDGPDRLKLEQLAVQLGARNIKFLGFVTETEKLDLLARATVFCSPALYGESFGIVLLEAMAMGVPVIAGDNPGYKAVLKDKGQIGLVNPKDTPAFARTLCLLMKDQEIRKLWQLWAKEYVTRFDYSKVVDDYERLYEKVIKDK